MLVIHFICFAMCFFFLPTLSQDVTHLTQMSSINDAHINPVPACSSVEPQKLPAKEPMPAAGSEDEKLAEQPLGVPTEDSDPDVVLVDYEENDPENPLNWSSTRKWLIILAISWMGFVR